MSKFINISEAASIAIHSLALVAGSKERMNANQMAAQLNFSKNHLSKILHLLTRHQFLDSVRGPRGGFKLRRNPHEISLLEVYELVEGSIEHTVCGIHKGKCPFSECVFGGISQKLTAEAKAFFENRSIGDILKQGEVAATKKQG
jgi:Rrf2 family protein